LAAKESGRNGISEEGSRILLEAAALSQLKEIRLNGKAIPTEWKGLKLDEIRLFMKSKRNGSAKRKQLKLLILGKERYGKTSLLHNLKQQEEGLSIGLMKTESTDGIDISTWRVDDNNDIIYSCWDFAGQRVSFKNSTIYGIYF
jgi:GTPase SAR1 family protein